jgi:hypothetical protein
MTFGLDYVSCSPYLIPIARLAAVLAVLRKKRFLNFEVIPKDFLKTSLAVFDATC